MSFEQKPVVPLSGKNAADFNFVFDDHVEYEVVTDNEHSLSF